MLPEIQIEGATVAYTAVVIVRKSGLANAIYWAPFRDQRPVAAFALNEHEVAALGQNGRLAVFDLRTGSNVRESETGIRFGKAQISTDRSTIYIWSNRALTSWQLNPLRRVGHF